MSGWCGKLTLGSGIGFPNRRLSEIDGSMSPPPDIDALDLAELKSLVLELLAERAEFQRTIGALRDEIARLKGGPGRPDIRANVKPDLKPSGMEKASPAQPPNAAGKGRRRGSTRAQLTIHEACDLKADAPAGSRFKGYASFVVQDLVRATRESR